MDCQKRWRGIEHPVLPALNSCSARERKTMLWPMMLLFGVKRTWNRSKNCPTSRRENRAPMHGEGIKA